MPRRDGTQGRCRSRRTRPCRRSPCRAINALKADFALRRSIDWLKRTDRSADRSTFVVRWTGRNRTTRGAAVVLMASVGPAARVAPGRIDEAIEGDLVRRARRERRRRCEDERRRAGGCRGRREGAGDQRIELERRGGTRRYRPVIEADPEARTRPSRLVPARAVASIRPTVAARVRNTARAGTAIGRPLVPSAPGRTVIVWYVRGRPSAFGETVTRVPVASQARLTSDGRIDVERGGDAASGPSAR